MISWLPGWIADVSPALWLLALHGKQNMSHKAEISSMPYRNEVLPLLPQQCTIQSDGRGNFQNTGGRSSTWCTIKLIIVFRWENEKMLVLYFFIKNLIFAKHSFISFPFSLFVLFFLSSIHTFLITRARNFGKMPFQMPWTSLKIKSESVLITSLWLKCYNFTLPILS